MNKNEINKRKMAMFEANDCLDPSTTISVVPEASASSRKQKKQKKEEKSCDPASINDLNDDCLERIFKHLPLISRLTVKMVCKHWRKASKLAWSNVRTLNLVESSAWNDLDELPPVFRSNTHIGTILKNCGTYLKELKLGDPCTYKILRLVGEHCVNLTRLEVAFARYGERFTTLFSQMERLQYFGMRNIRRDVHADFWGKNPPQTLNEIHLWGDDSKANRVEIPRVDSSALESFPHLSTITLEGFTLGQGMMTLIGSRLDLTFLSLANSRIEGDVLRVSQLTHLEHLNVSKLNNLNDNLLIQLTTNCKNLRYLNLSECSNVSSAGLMSLGNLPGLEEVVLNSCDVTDSIFRKLYSLKKLECRDCRNVHDDGIITLMNRAPNLRHLNLVHTGVSEQVLTSAAQVIKSRINNLDLWVIVDKLLKAKWDRCKEQIDSPLLIVDVAEKINDNAVNDGDTLMERYEESNLFCNPELERLNQFYYNYEDNDSEDDDYL